MTSGAANRLRYRQYTQFLHDGVDQLNLAITPDRLHYFRSRIRRERNRFLIWEVVWLLFAVAAAVPAALWLWSSISGMEQLPGFAAAVLPDPDNPSALRNITLAALSFCVFMGAAAIAMGPIIIYGRALNDLERANRRLKALRRQQQ